MGDTEGITGIESGWSGELILPNDFFQHNGV